MATLNGSWRPLDESRTVKVAHSGARQVMEAHDGSRRPFGDARWVMEDHGRSRRPLGGLIWVNAVLWQP